MTPRRNRRKKCQNVMTINVGNDRCPHIKVEILGTTVEGLLDSGAAVCIMSDDAIIKKHNLRRNRTNLRIRTADGAMHKCVSLIYIPYTFRAITRVVPTLLVPNIAKSLILGSDFWDAFRISPAVEINGKLTKLEVSQERQETLTLNSIGNNLKESTMGVNRKLKTSEQAVTAVEVEDSSLELPSAEYPSNGVVHKVETEHKLSPRENIELMKVVNLMKGDGNLGRTNMLEHKIELLEGQKPKRPPRYRWSPAIEKEIEK